MSCDVTVDGASGLCLFEKSDGRGNSFSTSVFFMILTFFIVKDFQTHVASPLDPDKPLSRTSFLVLIDKNLM